jgi:hypothetical protein
MKPTAHIHVEIYNTLSFTSTLHVGPCHDVLKYRKNLNFLPLGTVGVLHSPTSGPLLAINERPISFETFGMNRFL